MTLVTWSAVDICTKNKIIPHAWAAFHCAVARHVWELHNGSMRSRHGCMPPVARHGACMSAPKPSTWRHGNLQQCSSASHLQHHQGFATSASSGPPKDRIKAIPFLLNRYQADEAYNRYHSEQPLLAPLRRYEKAKEVFVPFWMMSGTVTVYVSSAVVNYLRHSFRYDKATGRTVPHTYTESYTVNIQQGWERLYSAEQLQMVASSKYPSSDIDRLKPGAAVVHARAFEPSMMDESTDGTAAGTGRLRRVYPFTVPPNAALKAAHDLIRAEEEKAVKAMVRQAHPSASEVTGIIMSITLRPDFSAHPVFVPVYVFTLKTPLLKLKMRTFVGAFPSAPVSGTRTYSGVKIASLAAAVTPIILLVAGIMWPWQRLLWLGSVLPGAVAGVFAHYSADMRAWWHRYTLPGREERQKQVHGDWDADWVRGLGDRPRAGGWQQQQQQQSFRRPQHPGGEAAAGASPGDPKGYYKLLGVARNASTSEIQAAFRAAAFKYHPDHSAERDKRKATVTFQHLQEAYGTLRDPQRRRQYDAMM